MTPGLFTAPQSTVGKHPNWPPNVFWWDTETFFFEQQSFCGIFHHGNEHLVVSVLIQCYSNIGFNLYFMLMKDGWCKIFNACHAYIWFKYTIIMIIACIDEPLLLFTSAVIVMFCKLKNTLAYM